MVSAVPKKNVFKLSGSTKHSFLCIFSSKMRGQANHSMIVTRGLNVWVKFKEV